MEDFSITQAAAETFATSPDLGIRVVFGATPAQATDAQPILFNSGEAPFTITLAPGTGIYARVKEKAE